MPPLLKTIAWVVTGIFALVVGIYNFGQAIEWFVGRYWQLRARFPRAPLELGFLEHDRLIEPLWSRIARIRGAMFKALNDAHKVARKFSDELGLVSVSHSEEDLVRVLTKTAKAMRGPARRLERLSAKYLKSVHALHESYKAVLARPGARVVFPKAIASLRKRQVAGYNVPQQLPDDIAAFKHERDALNSLRGHTSLMTRECDRYIAALEK